jgi:antitoxin ParD1/3/4
METKNVSLPVEQVEYIDAKVTSGEYAHASEVVRDAMRLMMEQEAKKLEWLRRAIQKGIESAEREPLIPDSEILKEIHKRAEGRSPNRQGVA